MKIDIDNLLGEGVGAYTEVGETTFNLVRQAFQ